MTDLDYISKGSLQGLRVEREEGFSEKDGVLALAQAEVVGWKKELNSGHILKTESTSFADRPDWGLGGKEERGVQCDFKFLAYTTSVTELSLKH